jgi:hypothetical protein
MAGKSQNWIVVGVAAVVVHLSGVIAGLEHDVSPGLAHTSLDLFHEIQPEWLAGVTAVKELARGTGEDKIAARAACTYLSTVNSTSLDQEVNKANILAQVPLEARSLPGVQAAVGSLATKLTGASQPGAAGHIYREACFGVG